MRLVMYHGNAPGNVSLAILLLAPVGLWLSITTFTFSDSAIKEALGFIQTALQLVIPVLLIYY